MKDSYDDGNVLYLKNIHTIYIISYILSQYSGCELDHSFAKCCLWVKLSRG